MDSFSGLLNNAALMLGLCVIYDTFGIYAIKQKHVKYCLTGILVGMISITVMITPWSLQPGVFFDTRWVLLSLCGLFFGFTPTVIAVIISGAFRLYQGGAGGVVGTIVIVVTACVGLAWRYWAKKHDTPLGYKELYGFGVLVQIAMLSCMLLMPAGMRIPILKAVSLPILLIYPVLTTMIGLVLKKQEDRRKTEKELMENRKILSKERGLLKGVINSIPDLIFLKNTQNEYIGCNKSFESFINCKEDYLIGKKDTDFFNTDTSRQHVKEDHHVLNTKKQSMTEKWVTYPDGRNVLLNTIKTPFKDLDGTLHGLVGISRDITAIKQAEVTIKDAAELNKKILSESPIGISIYDKSGQCIETNDSMGKIIGATKEQVLGQNYNTLAFWKTSGMLQKAKDSIIKEKTGRYEQEITTPFGQNLVADCYFVPFVKQGETHLMLMITDITERRKAEEEKRKAQRIAAKQEKNALVGQVAGKIAHDFNNILGIIMGNTELSLIDCKDIETEKTLKLILEQTIRGKNLTKNLVAFAKDQEIKTEFFRITEKIDLVLNLLKKDLEGIEVIRESRPGIPELLADPGMIEHAIVNLIQNAIHATSMTKHPQIFIRTYCLEKTIYFEIEDNGCGIPKAHIEDIYGPSFTLKGSKDITNSYANDIKGTGYGMSNVKKYIEQHKGSIFVSSEPGSGTRFTIGLPVIEKALTKEEKARISETHTHFKKYILLVEDETAISDVQYQMLTKAPCNHKVDIANNGRMAMDLFDRNSYDFISLDYMLPGKINGLDVYQHVRKTNKDIPILFISGNIEFLESVKALKQKDPNIEHLSKPCQNKAYVDCVNTLFTKKRLETNLFFYVN